MKVSAFASFEKGLLLKPFQYECGDLKPKEVLVQISHCGICHSDLHLIKDDWGGNERPLVPGHEIVGRVVQRGSKAKNLKLNQLVGIGWQNSSCGKCEYCKNSKENLCPQQQATCVGHYGGFASHVRVQENFAIPIPKTLNEKSVGPLLCGGITVFSPLEKYVLARKKKVRVGIIGVGGLGHIAIKMAAKMKADVFAISRSQDKKSEVKKWGAKDLLTYSQLEASPMQGKFDFILSTVPFDLEWQNIFKLLAPEATLCFVGIPNKPIPVPAFDLVIGEKAVAGSVIGSPKGIRKMLAFCAKHKIEPQVEVLPLEEVNQAMQRLEQSDVRYRFVLRVK